MYPDNPSGGAPVVSVALVAFFRILRFNTKIEEMQADFAVRNVSLFFRGKFQALVGVLPHPSHSNMLH